jgi:hypothetical protein
MKSNQTTSLARMMSRGSRPNMADLQPQVPSLSSTRFKHELFRNVDNPIVELDDVPRAWAPGMWSISIAVVERSPDKEVPDVVDKDLDPRDFEGASWHRGHFRA